MSSIPEPQIEDSSSASSSSRMIRSDFRRLGEIIMQYTNVSEDDINEALKHSEETGLALGEQLFQDGKLSEEERAKCLSVQWGMPYLDLTRSRVSRKAIHLVDHKFQRSSKVLVVQLKNGTITLALVDPLNVDVIDDIRVISGYDVKPVIVTEEAIEGKYAELFDTADETSSVEEEDVELPVLEPGGLDSVVQDAQSGLHLDFESVSASDSDEIHDLNSKVEEMPVIRLVDSILAQGIQKGASDLHFQCEADGLFIRYRVDGILQEGPQVPKNLMRVVAARIRVMANLDVSARATPQDGRVTLRAGQRTFELRVSVLPCVHGPKIVIRVAEQGNQMVDMEKMGFSKKVLDTFMTMIFRPYGIMLITGPTGSGKSTTLYSAVGKLNNSERNILTVEDPVEQQVRGVSQAQINIKAGLSFSDALRAALRQDPDIIMVGEIRDPITAKIAIEASLTGHLVLSTLHTNNASSAVTRLVDMGVESYLVASSLIGVIAQRLGRRVCQQCCEEYEPIPEALIPFGIKIKEGEKILLKKQIGCDACSGGYKGRVGIYELLEYSDALKVITLKGGSDTDIQEKAVEEGMTTLLDDVASKLLQGLTTMDEAQRVVFV